MLLEWWYKFGEDFAMAAENSMERLARSVARNPIKYIVGILSFVVLCMVGFLNFRIVTESFELWVPQDSTAMKHDRYLENNFEVSFRFGTLLFVAKSSIDNNVIDLDAFSDIWEAHDAVLAVTSSGQSYNELCAIRDDRGACFSYGVLQFFSNNRTYYDSVISTQQDLIDAISATSFPDGTEVARENIFGDYVVDASNKVVSAVAASTDYLIRGDSLSTALTWEERFIETASGFSTNSIDVYRFTNRSIDDELANSVGADIYLVFLTLLLMIAFTCFVLAKKRNLVETRTGLSLCGIATIILALIAAFGFCSGVGVFFTTIHQILPFIIVGIGVDDMYIIVAAFDAIDEKLPVEERLAQAMQRCGLSIGYTTATDMCAFFLGAMSNLPAIQVFCIYAGTTVIFNFVFQLTLFSALLVWDAERINKSNYDMFFCCGRSKSPSSEQDKYIQPAYNSDREGTNDMELTIDVDFLDDDSNMNQTQNQYAIVESSSELPQKVSTTQTLSPPQSPQSPQAAGISRADSPIPSSPTPLLTPSSKELHALKPAEELTRLQYFFGEVYFPMLTKPWFRFGVIVAFLAVLAANIYGTTQLSQGFDLIDLVADDSYVRAYMQTAREFQLFDWTDNAQLQVVYKDIPYHLQSTQEEMIRLQQEFLKDTEYNRGPWTSWIENFIAWAPSSASPYNSSVNADGYLVDEALFYQAVEDFLALPDYSRFRKDVNMVNATAGDASTLTISSSRVSAYHINLRAYTAQMRAMKRSRDLMDSAQFDPKPFAFAAIYLQAETEVIIVEELFTNLGLALVAVGLISLLVLIRPGGVALVMVLVVMIDVDLLGTMHYWDLRINTVTVVLLVMAIGLVVDYNAHVLHYYLGQSFALSPLERLRGCLVEIGPSVLLGCSTTFIGVLPLAFTSSVIFRTFFRMFFCIIVYGASHGLLLLPAILPSLPFTAVAYGTISAKEWLSEPGLAEEGVEKVLVLELPRQQPNTTPEGYSSVALESSGEFTQSTTAGANYSVTAMEASEETTSHIKDHKMEEEV